MLSENIKKLMDGKTLKMLSLKSTTENEVNVTQQTNNTQASIEDPIISRNKNAIEKHNERMKSETLIDRTKSVNFDQMVGKISPERVIIGRHPGKIM